MEDGELKIVFGALPVVRFDELEAFWVDHAADFFFDFAQSGGAFVFFVINATANQAPAGAFGVLRMALEHQNFSEVVFEDHSNGQYQIFHGETIQDLRKQSKREAPGSLCPQRDCRAKWERALLLLRLEEEGGALSEVLQERFLELGCLQEVAGLLTLIQNALPDVGCPQEIDEEGVPELNVETAARRDQPEVGRTSRPRLADEVCRDVDEGDLDEHLIRPGGHLAAEFRERVLEHDRPDELTLEQDVGKVLFCFSPSLLSG